MAPGDASSLNPKYVFDNFVTGNFNRIAHAAALAVAKEPGKTYNPLFMYGGVGLGKTHLMHAIGHEVLKNDPTKRVLYITCEKFTNELINAIRDNSTEAFRQKYRHIDLLMVDDVQFLTKKFRHRKNSSTPSMPFINPTRPLSCPQIVHLMRFKPWRNASNPVSPADFWQIFRRQIWKPVLLF